MLHELPQWPRNPHRHSEDVISAASSLCLECGLCCIGALFSWASVTANEIATLAATPIRPYGQPEPEEGEGEDADPLRMAQPCNCHQDGRCSIFPNRPEVCRSYSCGLLKATMNGSVNGGEAREIASRTKAQFEWLRMAAEKLGYVSLTRPSLDMVLKDFCTRIYPRAKSVPLHAHESEFAKNVFEYFQNVDRYFESSDDLASVANIIRELDTPKPRFEVLRHKIDRFTLGTARQLMELRNCIELIEPLSSIIKGWDIAPIAGGDTTSAALRVWKNEGQYYWDMPYPGPFGGFDKPLTTPLQLVDHLHRHIEELYSREKPAHFYLRSAAVEIGNNLILLGGKDKTVKTALGLELAARGHRLLADERLAVDSDTGQCFSLGLVPRIRLSHSHDREIGAATRLPKQPLGPHNDAIAYVKLPGHLLTPKGMSKPLSTFITLELSRQLTDTALVPINNAEALKALIPLHYGNTVPARRVFSVLYQNVQNATAFKLSFDSLEAAADAIEERFCLQCN